jgi:hypothetical protein
MKRALGLIAAAVTLGILAGCSGDDAELWPSLEASDPAGEEQQQSQTQSAQQQPGGPLQLNTGVFEPSGVTPGQPTGTAVGQKVQNLRGDLQRLQSQVAEENRLLQDYRATARQIARDYNQLVSGINARLQTGTTPGNPELVSQWNQAQGELSQVATSINNMNALAANTAATASLSSFLLESVRATYGLQGAVDEDHRQLAVLEDETNQTAVLIERLLTELTEDIQRQSAYLNFERSELTALSVAIRNGEFFAGSLGNRAYGIAAPAPAGGGAGLVGRAQPLVVIRFDEPNVDYEPALYGAVNQALQARPNAGFDVVGVAAGAGGQGEVALAGNRAVRNAEQVVRSLTNMGLPADRVSVSSTRNPGSSVNEVHVYLR